MIRPLIWMGVGAYAALWGRRKAIKTAERYVPKAVADRATASVKGFIGDVARAREEAKQAMTTRERELREGIARDATDSNDARNSPTSGPGADAVNHDR